MFAFREAWNLFQYDHSSPRSDDSAFPSIVQPSFLPDMDEQSPVNNSAPGDEITANSNVELIAELRRLREDLQQLQLTSDPNIDASGEPPHPNELRDAAGQASSRSDALRCWESCCNGRTFSNRSNLIRHQRERRGEKVKLRCSFCDAVFSRRSARDAHEAGRRCRR
ncbi:hypothetical protein BDV25DRAFT_138139 [Aspergillus avenaceus]|uniref:C2H2-type domain-containing protein n=1 Tax=Aspergillus avenaceus TaxID=36643 RepID=A0A5N6U0W0_ASPAV|nr:hypothetical protein BDV25DRAFT_138139 [Aspergillus avenaceus]